MSDEKDPKKTEEDKPEEESTGCDCSCCPGCCGGDPREDNGEEE